MSFAETFLPEFELEMANTRRLLEVVPAERGAWKPHPKSSSLGELSMHLANLAAWVPLTLERTELDVAPPGGPAFAQRSYTTPAATLKEFDENVARARAAIAAAPDESLRVPWTLKRAGAKVLTLPRAACLRSFVLSHMIHHRGQLTVYLRLCDVPLPRVYGPTADAAF